MHVQLSRLSSLFLSIYLPFCHADATPIQASFTDSATPGYQQGQAWLKQRLQQRSEQAATTSARANNLVLFVGDGMSVTTLTAARILQGQRRGDSGEENQLSFERFPYSALVKTYNTNQQTPDSAGTMSAITTGVKTRAGVISIGPEQDRARCAGSQQYHQQTLLEWAHSEGYATGIVTTARVTHATPAAAYAHSPERNWEADSQLTSEAEKHGCKDIAWQLIHQAYPQGLDIVLGGGKRNFHTDGERDQGNLINDWQTQFPRGQYLQNKADLQQLDSNNPAPVLGLFAASHLDYQYDKKANSSQPSLSLMTHSAVSYLKNKVRQQQLKGFILIVEGARIDHAHHRANAYRALDETIGLSDAVDTALQLTDADNTLTVVTADHSHTLSMAGYPQRGNPILAFTENNGVTLGSDNQPYTTLGYANGKGGTDSPEYDSQQHGRILWHEDEHRDINPQHPDFHQTSLAEKSSETHGSDDVALHANGPGAENFHGLLEQSTLFHLLKKALQTSSGDNPEAEQP